MIGTGFAPNFEGAVYRLLLQEMSMSWLVGQLKITADELLARFRRYVRWMRPYFPDGWANTLESLACRPVQVDRWGNHVVLDRAEANRIIASDLAFPHLNEEFKHYRE